MAPTDPFHHLLGSIRGGPAADRSDPYSTSALRHADVVTLHGLVRHAEGKLVIAALNRGTLPSGSADSLDATWKPRLTRTQAELARRRARLRTG